MFSSPIFTVSWRNNVLETWTLENHNTLREFCKIIFSMFTKFMSDIKYKMMEKTTRSSTLSLPVFMRNNPSWLLQCLLEILSAINFPKHLLDPVKKKNGYEESTWDFFPLHSNIFPYLQMCAYSPVTTGCISAHVYIYLWICMCLLHTFVHVYMYTCTYLLMCSQSPVYMYLVTYPHMYIFAYYPHIAIVHIFTYDIYICVYMWLLHVTI